MSEQAAATGQDAPRVVRDDAQSRYEAYVGDELAGELTYRSEGDALDFLHTFVEPEHRGQGIAGRLVEAALRDARAAGATVTPTCPYVARYIREHTEYADLVTPTGR